jgi:hypothetical protein
MQLNYPLYLNRKSEVVNGTGNAIIPEGTKVTWKVSALATQNIYWSNETTRFQFIKEADLFLLSKSIGQSIDYQIVTSNERIKDHEKLFYQLTVIKDQFPIISASYAPTV